MGHVTDTSATEHGLYALVARLDADIVEAEQVAVEAERRVAQLRAMRENAEQLMKYQAALNGSGGHVQTSGKKSVTDQVVQVFISHPSDVLNIDEVIDHIRETGGEVSVSSARNAVYYAATSGRLKRLGRGRFALKDSSTPAAAGVEVEGTP
jgi:hypothetical protein